MRVDGGDEADFALLRQTLGLAALGLARRRRAPRGIEGVPVVAQRGDVGAARVGAGGKGEKRVGPAADRLRHFLQVDQIEGKAGIGGEQREDRAPQRGEFLRAQRRGEIRRQQRSVVVAQVRAEPDQPPHHSPPRDRERKDEDQAPAAVATGDDGRRCALAPADVLLPFRHPVERLERGALGVGLEEAPVVLDLVQVAGGREADGACRRLPVGVIGHRRRRIGLACPQGQRLRYRVLRPMAGGSAERQGAMPSGDYGPVSTAGRESDEPAERRARASRSVPTVRWARYFVRRRARHASVRLVDAVRR